HGFVGYPFDYRVTLGFGSIAGGLDHVNHVIRLPLEHGFSRRCMIIIFYDMCKDYFMEVFMDDFSVFENSFDSCLNNLSKMLARNKLTSAPVIIALNSNLYFELMCDASDYAVGAVLGQRVDKKFRLIYYAAAVVSGVEGGDGAAMDGSGGVGRRVRESDMVDRIDRSKRSIFGFAEKSQPENFFGGDDWPAAGGGWPVGVDSGERREVMAAPVIPISSDSFEESVDSYVPGVILFGTIPTSILVIPVVPVELPIAPADPHTGSHYPKTYWESLPEDILEVITQRHTGSHYPKTYWESLPEDILGVTTLRHTGSHYPKTYWGSLPKDVLEVITRRHTRSHYPKIY
nr:hypothetical protein [Tanacetum cinerariifolium]